LPKPKHGSVNREYRYRSASPAELGSTHPRHDLIGERDVLGLAVLIDLRGGEDGLSEIMNTNSRSSFTTTRLSPAANQYALCGRSGIWFSGRSTPKWLTGADGSPVFGLIAKLTVRPRPR
jgi:hypothetical protein